MIQEDLIFMHNDLINSVINKYVYYFDRDDLYQVASMGLIKAFNNYNSNLDTKFSSYAYFWIVGEVKKFIRESNVFKVSKDMVKLNRAFSDAKNALAQSLGHMPSDIEVCNFLNVSEEKVFEARMANQLVSSLDYEDEDNINLYAKTSYEETSYDAKIMDLREEVSKLPDLERKLIEERYDKGMSQSETSRILGMSQAQISRKEKDILCRLRTRLE